jgi:TIR domain
MTRVFVSYSRNNLDAVTQLVQDLQAVGVQVWHDQTLTGGQRWWDNILANIRDCDIFVFALSPESWESEACRSELAYVSQLGKAILPVLVADGINLNLLPPPINEIQITDYRGRDKAAAFALVKSINMAPPAAPLPSPLPPSPHVPVSYLSTLKERIDSTAPLSAQDQIGLIFELEAGVREGRSAAEMHDLLTSLKRRDDLLAKVGVRIDEALKTLDQRAANQRHEPAEHRPYTSEPQRHSASPQQAPPRPSSAPPPAPPPLHSPAAADSHAKIRRYACAPGDTPQLIVDVKHWLDAEGFDLQEMNTEDGGVLLQIKKRGGWRDFVGMSTSLNIVFRQAGDLLNVEIGAGKWIDKAAVGTVSMFILWPLAVTAGYGAWEQMKMPDRIFGYIANRFVYR